ncbi:hypothetical protein LguiB_003404 [Lonicera macranthoides]
MSNDEEKRCPLCAEEMDWTDQQLKPCKCGYQVCVWCWNHIMDMTEKYEMGGRCPACRTPYDKEKVAGMEANFERVVSNNSNRKQKPTKAKPKMNEARKDLSNVRVIQRKIAYVIGLPLSLADEDVWTSSTIICYLLKGGGSCSVYTICTWFSVGGSRVQQIVGDTHNLQNRSGNVLPPPINQHWNISDNPAIRSVPKDLAIETVNSSGQLISSSSFNNKDEGIATPNKLATFVDIVGRSCSSGSEKDGNIDEDRIFNLCSQSSSVSIDEDYNLEVKHTVEMPCKESSSSHLVNGLPSNSEFKEPFREPSTLSAFGRSDITPNDASVTKEQSYLMLDSVIEDLLSFDDQRLKDNDSLSDLSAGCNTVNIHADEPSVQFTCANSIPKDGYNEGKFESSAKSDRVYRCSNLFSNEEIVEHLRRLDDDDEMTNGENSALDAVKSSIISNLMSLDLDAFDESSALFNETDGQQDSSWNFHNSDQSRFSFAKTGGSSSHLIDLDSSFSSIGRESKICSVLQDFGENKEHYLRKPGYNVSRAQSLIPPGFSLPSREPPPGFPACERTDQVVRSTSGNHLVKTSLPNNHFQRQSGGTMNIRNVDLIDPAILLLGGAKTTNGTSNSCLDMRSHYASSQQGSLEDEARLWLLTQQSAAGQQVPMFPQTYLQQTTSVHQEPRYSSSIGDRFSSWDDIYGISSRRLIDQQRTYNPSSFAEFTQQKFGNGHISNGGHHQPSLYEVQHRNEVGMGMGMGMGEVQRNETLGGVNKLLPTGYGDHMFQMPSSGDVYTRVFGM